MDVMSTGKFIEIGAAELKKMMDAGEAHVFDVREPSEHARARIPGTTLAPLSALRPEQIKVREGKRAVIYCASGNRTQHAAKMLLQAGHDEVIHLQGGIAAWARAGFPMASDPKAPLPIQRQVQLIAGFLVVAGAALAYAVDPAWASLAAFVGAGVLVAGLTGRCGLANCLAKLPHNKI